MSTPMLRAKRTQRSWVARRCKRRSGRLRVILVSGLLIWCLAVATIIKQQQGPSTLHSVRTIAQVVTDKPLPSPQPVRQPPESVPQVLAKMDDWLVSQSYPVAWRKIEPDTSANLKNLPSEILYRVGIAAIGAGEFTIGSRAFENILNRQQVPLALRDATELGRCRALMMMGRLDLAIPALSQAVMRPQLLNHKGTFQHLLAIALACRVIGVDEHLLDDSLPYANPTLTPSAEELLALLNAERSSPSAPPSALRVIYGRGQTPDGIEMAVNLADQTTYSALTRVVQAAGLELKCSEFALSALESQRRQLFTDSDSLSLIVDSLVEGAGLIWAFRGGVLYVQGAFEAGDEELGRYNRQIARRTLRRATVAHPDHGYRFESIQCLGDLAFLEGDAAKAANWYVKILERNPHSPIIARTMLNYAKLQGKTGRRDLAREAAYHVIDSPCDSKLKAAAYLYVARWMLEEDDGRTAVRPLQRALSLRNNAAMKAEVATMLVIAFLVDRNPHAASAVLLEHQDVLANNNVAAFLDAFVRFRANRRSDTSSLASSRHLLTALNGIQPVNFFGDIGYPLMAAAYGELGLQMQMVGLYEVALQSKLPEILSNRMVLELARLYLKNGDENRAAATLQKLTGSLQSPQVREGQFLSAEIEFHQGRLEACRDRCLAVLCHCESESEKIEILKRVGRTYEAESEHYKAALCFAGMLPDSKITQ